MTLHKQRKSPTAVGQVEQSKRSLHFYWFLRSRHWTRSLSQINAFYTRTLICSHMFKKIYTYTYPHTQCVLVSKQVNIYRKGKNPHNHFANIHTCFTKINLSNIMNDYNRKHLHSPWVSPLNFIK